jgi:hypothetical protein
MKPEHALHLQKMADLDGGHDDDYCRRDSCWDRQAGVIACFVFKTGGEDNRCAVCDHLRECHDADERRASKAQNDLFRKLSCPHPPKVVRLHPFRSGMVVCGDCGDWWSSAEEEKRRARWGRKNLVEPNCCRGPGGGRHAPRCPFGNLGEPQWSHAHSVDPEDGTVICHAEPGQGCDGPLAPDCRHPGFVRGRCRSCGALRHADGCVGEHSRVPMSDCAACFDGKCGRCPACKNKEREG